MKRHTCLHQTVKRSCAGERRTGFCPFHVATVAKTGQSIRRSHIWQLCNAFTAVLDFPYCQSLARFFCNVVNIHRHRPTARFICNDSCFCAILPYFDYRYRQNGEFLCNDPSVEESPAHFQTKSSPHTLNGTFHLSCRTQSGRLSEEFTSHFLLPKSSCRLSCGEGTD